MLNSAAGVVLPGTVYAPPMTTTAFNSSGSVGFNIERDSQIGQRPESHQCQLARMLAARGE